MKKIAIVIIASAGLAGCATHVWVKEGATQETFNVDRYQCMAGSQGQYTYVDQHGGSSYTGTNQPLVNACMTTRGYSWVVQKQGQ
jgi:hypothetical protein